MKRICVSPALPSRALRCALRGLTEDDCAVLSHCATRGPLVAAMPSLRLIDLSYNSIGDEGDVKTLMHEMGHAFQGWESLWIDSVDLRSPSLDACEVHSMGMEFLSLPHLDEFFSAEDCERFARGRWARGIQLLCYVSVVDAFQHWIYENPKASADERDACWVELQDRFMPGIDWSGEAERHRAARWYAQMHVFRRPFYYLDYAIAETGATGGMKPHCTVSSAGTSTRTGASWSSKVTVVSQTVSTPAASTTVSRSVATTPQGATSGSRRTVAGGTGVGPPLGSVGMLPAGGSMKTSGRSLDQK